MNTGRYGRHTHMRGCIYIYIVFKSGMPINVIKIRPISDLLYGKKADLNQTCLGLKAYIYIV